jgi:hypothetical protein
MGLFADGQRARDNRTQSLASPKASNTTAASVGDRPAAVALRALQHGLNQRPAVQMQLQLGQSINRGPGIDARTVLSTPPSFRSRPATTPPAVQRESAEDARQDEPEIIWPQAETAAPLASPPLHGDGTPPSVVQRARIEWILQWSAEIAHIEQLIQSPSLSAIEIRRAVNQLWELAQMTLDDPDPNLNRLVDRMIGAARALDKKVWADNGISVYDANSFTGDLFNTIEHLSSRPVEARGGPDVIRVFSFEGMTTVSERKLPIGSAHVLAQADYMSGDRYSVAAALAFNPGLGVVVLIQEGDQAKGLELYAFYEESVGSDQLGFCITGNPQILYKSLINMDGAKSFNQQAGTALNFVPVTTGTTVVADAFQKNPSLARETLREAWFGTSFDLQSKASTASLEAHDLENELMRWLVMDIGMPPAYPYALLWVKTGAMTAEKAHHFTAPEALAQLIEGTRKIGRVPVVVGDDVGVHTQPELGAFWKNQRFRTIAGGGRIAQLRLLDVLNQNYDIVSVGMRSGILEGPALIGMRTIYLEERGNQQPGRMEKLLRSIPNYMRVVLDAPAGHAQKNALADLLDRVRLQLERSKAPDAPTRSYIELLQQRANDLRTANNPDIFSGSEMASIIWLMNQPAFHLVQKFGRFDLTNVPLKDVAAQQWY